MKSKFVWLILFALMLPGPASAQKPGYRVLDSMGLGPEGGWDYLAVDTAAHRLYISRSIRVEVLDLKTLAPVGDIEPTMGVHGIAIATEFGKGFTSNGRDSSVTVFDLKSLATLATIHLDARNPDAIAYDPTSKRVFTFNGGTGNSSAIDAATNMVVGSVVLGGKPEFAVVDRGKVYVNIEDKNEVVKFDTKTLKVLHHWSIAPGEEPSGLAIDPVRHRLFSACGNKLMVVLDENTGAILSTVPIGAGVDGAACDESSGLAFSSNGEGTVTVVKGERDTRYTVDETVPTVRGARTIVLDGSTHRLYTVSAKFGKPPEPTAERPRPRPPILPETVKVYVLGR